ncbi:MAG: DUF3313 domain-containing protein [Phycisphaerales bacterium]|nr:DUF3313 domain-containing protein [Phycisphaerales bacterium]
MLTRILLVSAAAAAALAAAPAGCRRGVLNQDPMAPGMGEAVAPKDPVVKRAAGADFAAYSMVFVEEPSIAPDATQGADVKPDQLRSLQDTMRDDLKKAFGDRYKPVGEIGDGTLLVRTWIMRAVPNSPLQNIAPQSQVGRGGYGYAAIRIEVLDSRSRRELLSFTHERSTERFSLEKLSEWGSVQKSFSTWADEVATLAR